MKSIKLLGMLSITTALLLAMPAISVANVIVTVAGGFLGDGGAATNAALNSPYGVAVDSSGNLYIADQNNNRIRKVTASGIISTVAGGGYFGDGGSATNAALSLPTSVALDNSGNLYIAEQYNNRIRKVNTLGIISTIAGNGTVGCTGDGGSATNAALNSPSGVAVDSFGNLYIADTDNNLIREVLSPFTYSTNNGASTITRYTDIGGNESIPVTLNGLPVTCIGCGAFSNCASINSLVISGNITNIGASAFASCSNLLTVYFTGNAPSANPTAFSGDNNTVVYYLPGHTGWTNSFGGVTPILWNPQAQNLVVRTNSFGFNITGPTNAVIVVEACTNLVNPVWYSLTNATLTSGAASFSDLQWTNYPNRFYRFRSP